MPLFRLGKSVSFVVGLCVGALIASLAGRVAAPAAIAEGPAKPDLAAEIELIKGKLPDQAHAMQDVGYHFTNVWFAGQKEHWELATFYLSETKSHLRWAVRIIPRRKDKAGKEVDLQAILQATENGPLAQLQKAIEAKDGEQFAAAYKFTLETCYACHKASDKPFLKLQIPTEPEVRIINFDPQAKWPL